MRIPSPTNIIMKKIIKKEDKENSLSMEDYNNIIKNSDHNINKIKQNVLLCKKGLNLKENYKIVIDNIYKNITLSKYNMKNYYNIRNEIYDLYTDNNNEQLIFMYLYNKFLKDDRFNINKKTDFIKESAILNHKMSIGNKEPLYLERLINTIIHLSIN